MHGPTVRRLRREREQRRRLGREEKHRQERRPYKIRLPAAQPGTGDGPVSAFPLGMARLLQLDRCRDLVVLDDQIGQFVGYTPGSESQTVEVRGRRRTIRFDNTLSGRLITAMQQHQCNLERWARGVTTGECFADLDALGDRPDTQTRARIKRFVDVQLVPHLQKRASPPAQVQATKVPGRPLAGDALAEMDRFFAFFNRRWYRLVPFYGTPAVGQFHLRIGQSQFLGSAGRPQVAMLEHYDQLLQQVVRQALMASPRGEPRRGDLYRDADYAVIRTPADRVFFCRQVPAYAVEGPEGQFYYFDPVEIGVQLTGTATDRVVCPGAARIMHPYSHMFVQTRQTGSSICMPLPEEFYERIGQMPLEAALLHYLEAARLTLCSGYTRNCVPHHQIQTLKRPLLSPDEAARCQVPLYRSYRSARG